MSIRPFLSSPTSRTRILFVGIGVVLLVLGANQLVFQRWAFAAIQGGLGLGFLLAGALSSDATLLKKGIGRFFKAVLWNMAFVAAVVVVTVSIGPAGSGVIAVSMPYIAALWLLVVGARFAKKRMSIIVIAVIASLLLLLQCAVLGVGILLSPYNFEHRTQSQVLLAAVLLTGAALVWWFLRAKLSPLRSKG